MTLKQKEESPTSASSSSSALFSTGLSRDYRVPPSDADSNSALLEGSRPRYDTLYDVVSDPALVVTMVCLVLSTGSFFYFLYQFLKSASDGFKARTERRRATVAARAKWKAIAEKSHRRAERQKTREARKINETIKKSRRIGGGRGEDDPNAGTTTSRSSSSTSTSTSSSSMSDVDMSTMSEADMSDDERRELRGLQALQKCKKELAQAQRRERNDVRRLEEEIESLTAAVQAATERQQQEETMLQQRRQQQQQQQNNRKVREHENASPSPTSTPSAGSPRAADTAGAVRRRQLALDRFARPAEPLSAEAAAVIAAGIPSMNSSTSNASASPTGRRGGGVDRLVFSDGNRVYAALERSRDAAPKHTPPTDEPSAGKSDEGSSTRVDGKAAGGTAEGKEEGEEVDNVGHPDVFGYRSMTAAQRAAHADRFNQIERRLYQARRRTPRGGAAGTPSTTGTSATSRWNPLRWLGGTPLSTPTPTPAAAAQAGSAEKATTAAATTATASKATEVEAEVIDGMPVAMLRSVLSEEDFVFWRDQITKIRLQQRLLREHATRKMAAAAAASASARVASAQLVA